MKQLLQPSIHTDDDEPPYWANWTSDYDYIYVLFTGTAYPNPDPARLTPVYAGNRFMLYKITAPVADAGLAIRTAGPATVRPLPCPPRRTRIIATRPRRCGARRSVGRSVGSTGQARPR